MDKSATGKEDPSTEVKQVPGKKDSNLDLDELLQKTEPGWVELKMLCKLPERRSYLGCGIYEGL